MFKPNGQQCNWPGCNRPAGKTTLKVVSKSVHCLHHHLKKFSGCVGGYSPINGGRGINWGRDHYREHLKPDPIDYAHERKHVIKYYPGLSWLETHYKTLKCFDVDHIDGNHDNNHPDNLQTLSKSEHIIKSMANGDLNLSLIHI